MPYTQIMKTIWEKDAEALHEQVTQTATKYRKLRDRYLDELLCIRAVGLCNLARMRGMPVTFDHKYIPQALI